MTNVRGSPLKVACNTPELVPCGARKCWNCNEGISMYERLIGELHAKLLRLVAVVTRARRFRQSADPLTQNERFSEFFAQWVCSLASIPPHVGASPPPNGGNCTTRGSDTPTTRSRRASCSANPPIITDVERSGGAGGPGCGARGRWQGLVGLRADAPATRQHARPHWSGGCRRAWRPGCGARGRWRGLAGLRADAPSAARGADGERAGRRPRAHRAARPARARQRPEHSKGPEAPQRLGPHTRVCQWLTG